MAKGGKRKMKWESCNVKAEEKAEHPRDSALTLKGMVECVAGEANVKRES
jgi:hypothetical protein